MLRFADFYADRRQTTDDRQTDCFTPAAHARTRGNNHLPGDVKVRLINNGSLFIWKVSTAPLQVTFTSTALEEQYVPSEIYWIMMNRAIDSYRAKLWNLYRPLPLHLLAHHLPQQWHQELYWQLLTACIRQEEGEAQHNPCHWMQVFQQNSWN